MLTGQDKTSSRWVERPRDPALEALFLAKLMQKFGLTDAQSKQLMTDARPATAPVTVDMAAGGAATLDLQESFDRAWLRVGLALDRTNFTVDNRDRAEGHLLRALRRFDAGAEEGRAVRQAVLQRQSSKKPAQEFLVNVRPKGDTLTQVAVVDANGQVDTSSDAQHIVSLLHAQLN